MDIKFNGIKLKNIVFNGIDLVKVLSDGIVVFLKALLYDNGVKNVDWNTNIYVANGYSSNNAYVSFEDNQIIMYSRSSTVNNKNGDCLMYTRDKINLEDYSKLYAEICANVGNGTSSIEFGIISTLPTPTTKPVFERGITLKNYNTITKVEMDVSDINNSYNVGFWNWSAQKGIESTLTIKKVWLE